MLLTGMRVEQLEQQQLHLQENLSGMPALRLEGVHVPVTYQHQDWQTMAVQVVVRLLQ